MNSTPSAPANLSTKSLTLSDSAQGTSPKLTSGFTDNSGTRWKFSLLPLGGYVKMHGDADEASTKKSNEDIDPKKLSPVDNE